MHHTHVHVFACAYPCCGLDENRVHFADGSIYYRMRARNPCRFELGGTRSGLQLRSDRTQHGKPHPPAPAPRGCALFRNG